MATVDRDPSHVPAAVQRHHRLVCYEHGGDLHLLHQDLGHLGLVLLAGEWLLGDQERLGGGLGFELVLEDVVPDCLQVVPVLHHALPDGVVDGQDAPQGLGLGAHVAVLEAERGHGALQRDL